MKHQSNEPLLLMSFQHQGEGDTYRRLVELLAGSVVNAPGLVWKMWFISDELAEAGTLYLFQDGEALEHFLSSSSLQSLKHQQGVHQFTTKVYHTLNEVPLIALKRWQISHQHTASLRED